MRRQPIVWILVLICSMFGQLELIAQKRNYDTLPNLPEHYTKRLAEFKKQPIVKGKVIMLGNSITEGGNWKKLLKDSTVINRGISGDVTFGVINRLDDIIKRQPSKVFLLIGINDLSRKTPDEVILENLFSIVSKIRSGSPSTEVFVQSILPTNETFKNFIPNFKGKASSILTINTQLQWYANKMKFTYVDLYSKFLDANGLMDAKYATDGLHLNELGYQHWVSILRSTNKTGIK
ncbi:MAG: GDSL-type esterase/lipase family protein [Cyclobacteriaceae bacterium]